MHDPSLWASQPGEQWTPHCTWHKPRSCTRKPLHPAVPAEGLYDPGVECWGFPGRCLLCSGPRWSDSAAAVVWSEECCQNHCSRVTEERLLIGCSLVKTHHWHIHTSTGLALFHTGIVNSGFSLRSRFKIHTWKSGTRINIDNAYNHWGSSHWRPRGLDLDNVHHRLLSLFITSLRAPVDIMLCFSCNTHKESSNLTQSL